MLTRLKYLGRVAAVALRSPMEFADRLSGQLEVRGERGLPKPTLNSTGDAVPELCRIIGQSPPPQLADEFEQVWAAVAAELQASGHVLGKGYDGGRALAEVAFAAVRMLKPDVVVETGVARGITSRVILEAMMRNGVGHLHSIDLPPLASGWEGDSATAVSAAVKSRWTYVRGASRRRLEPLLRQVGPVPMFIHDSLHTYKNMQYELQTGARYLRPGGLILCDDIEDNESFSDFVRQQGGASFMVKEPYRTGFIGGLVPKPGH